MLPLPGPSPGLLAPGPVSQKMTASDVGKFLFIHAGCWPPVVYASLLLPAFCISSTTMTRSLGWIQAGTRHKVRITASSSAASNTSTWRSRKRISGQDCSVQPASWALAA